MCRLLCYMGEAIPMDLLITKPEHSLVFQSRDASFHPGCLDKRNIRVNGDGFGIAWYNPKKIEEGGCLVKFPTPAWSSPNLLNIAKFVESGLVFAHVRAASDGAALVGNVNHENTHPFTNKRYTFMHNGGIPGFDTMKRQLLTLVGDEAYQSIEGTTDSEVCFAFFLDELPSTDAKLGAAEIAQVLRRTIARIVSAVARFAQPGSRASTTTAKATTTSSTSKQKNGGLRAISDTQDCGEAGGVQERAPASSATTAAAAAVTAPPMSLNFCVTDGRHIVCSRYRNHAVQNPPSMFVLAGAGFACDKEGSCLRLTATEPRTSVVISSEPLCRSTKSWELVPRNSMVIVEGAAPTAATATNSNGTVTDDTPVRQGLVSSIKFEPLRCHPSDTPNPNDPAFSEPFSLPTSCVEGVHETNRTCGGVGGGGGGYGANGGREDNSIATTSAPPFPLQEESVNVVGGSGSVSNGANGGGGSVWVPQDGDTSLGVALAIAAAAAATCGLESNIEEPVVATEGEAVAIVEPPSLAALLPAVGAIAGVPNWEGCEVTEGRE